MFKNLKRKVYITKKELKYFGMVYKKATNLDKLYLLPKIYDFSGRKDQLYQIFGNSLKNFLEFLHHVLKSVMKQNRSYFKESNGFIKELKEIKEIPEDVIMVAIDAICFCPSILERWMIKQTKNLILRISLKWQNLFWKATTLNLMVKLNNNFPRLILVPSWSLHTLVYFWIKLKLNFSSHKYTTVVMILVHRRHLFYLDSRSRKA